MARLSLRISTVSPMFYFADNGPGHGVNPFVPVPANQAAPSPIHQRHPDRWIQIQSLLGQGWFTCITGGLRASPARSLTTNTADLWDSDKAAKLARDPWWSLGTR